MPQLGFKELGNVMKRLMRRTSVLRFLVLSNVPFCFIKNDENSGKSFLFYNIKCTANGIMIISILYHNLTQLWCDFVFIS